MVSVCAVSVCAAIAEGRSIVVRADGSGDYPTIQAAIDEANDGDIIELQAGTYTGPRNRDIDFLGKAIAVRSTDPNDPCVVAGTIIDCSGTGTEPHRGFYFHNGETVSSVLKGVKIIGGYEMGSAIYCTGSSPTISDCFMSQNQTGSHQNGTVYLGKSSARILHCSIYDNHACDGGGIYVSSGSPLIRDCFIVGNLAHEYHGGGIYLNATDANVINCVIQSNEAHYNGGGMYCKGGKPKIERCIIMDSKCTNYGAGIGLWETYANVSNCCLTDNSGYEGGAFFCNKGGPVIINCTVTKNYAYYGGAIYGSKATFLNCIIWLNKSRVGPPEINGSATISYSDIRGSHPGIGNINIDPLFCDTANSDYHLLTMSPCINNGDPNYDPEPNEIDLDGIARVIGGRIDMGCYEFNHCPIAGICEGQRLFDWEGPFGARISLDGSCSSDLDSSRGTNDDIEHFEWYRVDPCQPDFEDFLGNGQIIDCNLPVGEHTIVLEVIDHAGACDTNEVTITVLFPIVEIVVPQSNTAVQDGVILTAEVSYMSDVNAVSFYLREPNDGNGTPIGYEHLSGTFNTASGRWECNFDTTWLNDGYYVILAKVVNNRGNEIWSNIVPFSIRNWAVLELLPASRHFRAGRAVPIKFTLRINETVDPAMPFVYNEGLEIRIFDVAAPGNILQTSFYGDGSKDYRIDSAGQLYITNFKTAKTPAVYGVEILRTASNFQIGTFTFSTEILGNGDLTGDGKTDINDLVVIIKNWLGDDSIADIAPGPDGDGTINLLDFVVMADYWLEGM